MLTELSIKNFAIIDHVSLNFNEGLTVITGETGAGKSIIIDAISILCGGRGSIEYVRHNKEKAEIEGLFIIKENERVHHKCIEFGIEIEDGMLVLQRTISKSGKNVCRINGKLVTISILREIGQLLVDIHGQHEHQALLNGDYHLQFLDRFKPELIQPTLNEYSRIYERFINLKKQLKFYSENEKQIAHRLDLIQFQLNEIQSAKLNLNEDQELMEEKIKLSNYDRLHSAIKDSYHALALEHRGLDWVGLVMSELESCIDLSPEIKSLHDTVANCFYSLEEVSFSLRSQLDSLEYDPNKLNDIQHRLNEIKSLKKKYGESIEDILEYAASIEDELDSLSNKEGNLEEKRKQLSEVIADLNVEAHHLSQLRKEMAIELTESVHKELKDLFMEKAKFEIMFRKFDESDDLEIHFKQDGIDSVEFYISSNPGEPPKPLSKVASGGELSRMMLAFKNIFSKQQGIGTMILDEVDTGVSGRVAQAIAEKVQHISTFSQVFCITHLPQVAAMADTHLYISKSSDDHHTETNVRVLSKEEIVNEISRMISGVEITDLTLEHANELVQLAQNIKNKQEAYF